MAIVVYPMLVSQAVSENIVPGIAKTVEQYLIVNAKDSLMKDPSVKMRYNFKIKAGKLVTRESVDILEGEEEWGGRTKEEKEATEKRANAKDARENAASKRAEAATVMAAAKNKRENAASKRAEAKEHRENAMMRIATSKDAREEEQWEHQRRRWEADEAKWEAEEERAENQEKRAHEAETRAIDAESRANAAEVRADEELIIAQNQSQLDRDKWIEKDKVDKAKEERDVEKHKKDMEDKTEKSRQDADKEAKEKEMEDAKKAAVSINIQDNKAMSIEPTFIEIERMDKFGNRTPESLGIKVVPLRIKSDAKLSRLILHDVKLKYFNTLMVSWGRKILRRVWRLIDRWTGSMRLGGLTPSGDPRRDIIMARTGHKGEGFVVLSKGEDIDDIFLSNIKKINRLFMMGWGNIIIVDDVNRVAYFCMRTFKGVCTAISYAMIYQNFGALKVYDSLEDAKRQTSSIFKIRKQFSKIVAEWIVHNRQSKYLSEGK